MTTMDSIQLQQLLNRYNIKPSRSKGQNFLLDEDVIARMVEVAGVRADDLVVEIGPGLGVLTKALCEKAKAVLAIELDENAAVALRKELVPKHANLTLWEGDALSTRSFHHRVEWLAQHLSSEPNLSSEPHLSSRAESRDLTPSNKTPEYKLLLEKLDRSYKIVANLPYQITSKFLRSALEDLPRPSTMVVMLQKEVAERAAAKPGSMSLLSLAVQAYSEARIVEIVRSTAFYPQPEVDSAVLACDLTKPDAAYASLSENELARFWRLAKAGFASRRKQLKNNLALALPEKTIAEVVALLAEIGLKSTVRAQELSVADWCNLVRKV